MIALAGACLLVMSGCGDAESKTGTNVATGPGVDIRNAGTGPTNNGFNTGSGWDSGLDDSKSLDEVTATEAASACAGFETYLRNEIGEQELLDFSCNIQGFFSAFDAETDAQAQMLCATARDQCLAESQELEFGCPLEDAEGCSVTVGQVEACTNKQFELFEANIDQFQCSNASTNPEALAFLDQDIPECRPIQECDDTVPVEGDTTPPGGG